VIREFCEIVCIVEVRDTRIELVALFGEIVSIVEVH